MIIRARTVLPVAADPVPNGAIAVSGNRLQAVGPWPDIRAAFPGRPVFDLGDAAILPGLVNAHCHLDYTDMAGLWPPPKKFIDWIPLMLAAKAEWSYTEYAHSWLKGARMLLHSGVTTVADIECAPELLPEVWESIPLRVVSFLEMTGVRSKRQPDKIIGEALQKIQSLSHRRCHAALSPHAPYSTSETLLRLCARAAAARNLLVSTHVAESLQEFEMFAQARGEMFNWLKKNGRDVSDCGLGSPVQHLERAGLLGEYLLAVHANYLDQNDVRLLARRKVTVVHCPRSHAYFAHQPFPLQRLKAAGVNLCLGTDSLATVARAGRARLSLDLFEEMRHLSRAHPVLPPRDILEMATLNGARALARVGEIGCLSPGALADWIAIPFAGKTQDIYDALLHHASTISAGMIDGHWTVMP